MYIKLTKEVKESLIDKIQTYFLDERSEEMGRLAAENVLHFFIEEISPAIYNQAIEDAKYMVDQRLSGIEEDLDSLRRVQKASKRG